MGKVMAGAGMAAVLVASMAVGQQRERLPAECRQQILALCQMGGGMRECVRAAFPKLSEPCRTAISERSAAGQPLPSGMAEMAYGREPLQRLDLAAPAGNKRPPLVLFIHGGGWSIGAKAGHFLGKGYAFASVTDWSRRPRSSSRRPTSPPRSPG